MPFHSANMKQAINMFLYPSSHDKNVKFIISTSLKAAIKSPPSISAQFSFIETVPINDAGRSFISLYSTGHAAYDIRLHATAVSYQIAHLMIRPKF